MTLWDRIVDFWRHGYDGRESRSVLGGDDPDATETAHVLALARADWKRADDWAAKTGRTQRLLASLGEAAKTWRAPAEQVDHYASLVQSGLIHLANIDPVIRDQVEARLIARILGKGVGVSTAHEDAFTADCRTQASRSVVQRPPPTPLPSSGRKASM